jgi:hypothetical protein
MEQASASNTPAAMIDVPDPSRVHLSFLLLGLDEGPGTLESCYRLSLDWFERLGLKPKFAEVNGAGMSFRRCGFKTAHAKLEERGFGDVGYFHFSTGQPDAGMPSNEVEFAAYAGFSGKIVVGGPSTTPARVLEHLRAIVDALGADYGWISLSSDGTDGMGPMEGVPKSLDQIESDWRKHGSGEYPWRSGLVGVLRSWNIVPDTVMAGTVDGVTLARWIEAGPHRGSVERFGLRTWLWTIAPQDLPAILKALWRAGILFDDEKYRWTLIRRHIDGDLLERASDGVSLRRAIQLNPLCGNIELLPDGGFAWTYPRECRHDLPLRDYGLVETEDGHIVGKPDWEPTDRTSPDTSGEAPRRAVKGRGDPLTAGFAFFVQGFMVGLKEYATLHDEENSDHTLRLKTRFRKMDISRALSGHDAQEEARILILKELTQVNYPKLPFDGDNAGVQALNAMRATSGGSLENELRLIFQPACADPRDWRLARVESERDGAMHIAPEDSAFAERAAAFFDDVWIQYLIYSAYRQGKGVKKDMDKAFHWVHKAAHNPKPSTLKDRYIQAPMFFNGSAAKCDLADMHQLGLGVAQDDMQALHWYERAAEQGNHVAQYSLGTIYLRGLGVAANRQRAIAYYRDSAARHWSKAEKVLKLLETTKIEASRGTGAA